MCFALEVACGACRQESCFEMLVEPCPELSVVPAWQVRVPEGSCLFSNLNFGTESVFLLATTVKMVNFCGTVLIKGVLCERFVVDAKLVHGTILSQGQWVNVGTGRCGHR